MAGDVGKQEINVVERIVWDSVVEHDIPKPARCARYVLLRKRYLTNRLVCRVSNEIPSIYSKCHQASMFLFYISYTQSTLVTVPEGNCLSQSLNEPISKSAVHFLCCHNTLTSTRHFV